MTKRRISMHPLDGLDPEVFNKLVEDPNKMSSDEKRHWGEVQAMDITKNSSIISCANVFSRLLSPHLDQVNAQRYDKYVVGHHYSNPAEMLKQEAEKNKHKEFKYTGNIAQAHQQLDSLQQGIVSEKKPNQLAKSIFWWLLFGLAFAVLAVWSIHTGAAFDFVAKLVVSKVFLIPFVVVTIALSLFFGFFSAGVLLIGGLLLFTLILDHMPGLASFVFNGVLVIVALFLLWMAWDEIKTLFKYLRLSPEERKRNQANVDEKLALQKELNEYSDLMYDKVDIINSIFWKDCSAFEKEVAKEIHGISDHTEYKHFFSYLRQYYRKMTK